MLVQYVRDSPALCEVQSTVTVATRGQEESLPSKSTDPELFLSLFVLLLCSLAVTQGKMAFAGVLGKGLALRCAPPNLRYPSCNMGWSSVIITTISTD